MRKEELDTLLRALSQAVAPRRTFLCPEMEQTHRELSWLGVNYAAAALLGPPSFTREDDRAQDHR